MNHQNNIASDYNNKLKYLKSYFWIIQDLLDELIRNEDDSVQIASQITGMPKSQVIRTLDDLFIERQMKSCNITKNIERLFNKKKQIEDSINKLEDPQERYVLRNKYLYFKTLEEISININKSYKHIKRCHTDAINNLVIPELKMTPDVP